MRSSALQLHDALHAFVTALDDDVGSAAFVQDSKYNNEELQW
jgi:hypothetical protein